MAMDTRNKKYQINTDELMARNITEAVCEQFGDWMAKQVPFNLKTVAVIKPGDNGALLNQPVGLDIHSRFLFVTELPNTPPGSIEIFSLANPEEPEHIGNITDAFIKNG